MDFIILKQNSPTWEYIWDELAKNPINDGLEHRSIAMNDGEAWQYFGTITDGKKWYSDFKHRLHPYNNLPKYITIEHPNGIPDEDITSRRQIK
jgi:hypothetical protein